jgi:hypothetical protein
VDSNALSSVAGCGHRSPLVAVVVKAHQLDWLADYEPIARQREMLLKRLPEIPDPFVIAACFSYKLVNTLIQDRRLVVLPSS